MKLIRIAIAIVVALVLLLGGGLLAAFIAIDGLLRQGVEEGATYALQVPVTLGSADIEVFAGTLDLAELDVANPPGFTDPNFLQLGSAGAAVSLASLSSDTVEIPSLTMDKVLVSIEKKEGKANYEVILDNLARFEGASPDEGEPPLEPAPPSKQIIIRRIEITNVEATVDLLPIGGQLSRRTVVVPEIILTDVGGADGVDVAEVVNIVMKAIFASIIRAAGELPGDILAELENGLGGLGDLSELGVGLGVDLGEGIVNVVGDVTAEAGKAVESAANAAAEAAKQGQEAVEKVQEDAEAAVDEAKKAIDEGIGNLFGGGKKEDG